jgi:8-oxo-dGTP diphosphatase
LSHVIKEIIKDISIDCVIFGYERNVLEILLIKRARKPEKNRWALPGGFIKKGELIVNAVARILQATTGISENIYLEEVGIFDELDRFPLRRVFTIAHFALVSPVHYQITTGIDTTDIRWFELNKLPRLPFDHNKIIDSALAKLRTRVRERPIGFELLPQKFTLPQLQSLYEEIIRKKIDKRNFRKKILGMNLIKATNERESNNKRRPAQFYRFDKLNYDKLKKKGFIFEL